MKVKQLEREVDRHKHGASQLMQRNEQLVKELENHRQQLHHSGMQMENMKRELGDALVCNMKRELGDALVCNMKRELGDALVCNMKRELGDALVCNMKRELGDALVCIAR